MTKLVSLELDYTIKVSSRVHNYLSPNYVFFPLKKTSKLLIKDKEKVLKGQPLLVDQDRTIFSTVSGQVAGIKKYVRNNEDYHYIVVENDYKEKSSKKSTKKSLNIKNKDELQVILKDYGINLEFEERETLLLNAIDSEPYIVNNSMFLNKNLNSILETLDILKSILNYKSIIILIKNTETEVLTKINDLLGTYPDFKVVMVPNYYLIERKENYKTYLEVSIDDVFALSLKDFNRISEAIEKDKPLMEKYITITGDQVKNPVVINAKIGSLLRNIIDDEIKFLLPSEDLIYYVNGLMKGHTTDLEGLVVDDDFEGLVITKNSNYECEKCIKCGLCLKHCPLNISPIDHYINNKEIKCLNCGLCSFICPSNIDFKNITKKDDSYE